MDFKQQTLKAEKRLLSAILDKNLALLSHLFDEEYNFTSTRGETWGKEKTLADFRDPGFSIQELSISELEVTVRHGTAVVTGTAHVEGHGGKKPLTGEYRFTRIWCISDGDWRIVAAHASHIDP